MIKIKMTRLKFIGLNLRLNSLKIIILKTKRKNIFRIAQIEKLKLTILKILKILKALLMLRKIKYKIDLA